MFALQFILREVRIRTFSELILSGIIMMLVLGGCAFESSSSINTHITLFVGTMSNGNALHSLFSMCCIPAKTECEDWDPYDILCFLPLEMSLCKLLASVLDSLT